MYAKEHGKIKVNGRWIKSDEVVEHLNQLVLTVAFYEDKGIYPEIIMRDAGHNARATIEGLTNANS